MKIFKCNFCRHEGPRAGNGYAHWCAGCGVNNQLELLYDTEERVVMVNGNAHLANMEVTEYNGLKFVIESPQEGAVRLTIYQGSDTTPLSRETYGSCNMDKQRQSTLPPSCS